MPRKTALWDVNAPLMVAISAGSASLRATIEALARRCGAQVSAERGLHDLLLMALDSSTPLPPSIEALTLLIPSGERVCVIWTGTAPPRGTVSRLLRAGVAGVVSLDIPPARLQSALRAIHAGLLTNVVRTVVGIDFFPLSKAGSEFESRRRVCGARGRLRLVRCRAGPGVRGPAAAA